ncbi:hypothetical protein HPB50_018916 [Hyalomma asiaticum]|uniref:Uncharacterized protein n=1 Tax=Hyalomma asiaticum TaxID=266040 RepID=A0ACB7TMR7_HYAAI|nr:hypothetical protein HPB50_018916 [Hyalomma asiaticum]
MQRAVNKRVSITPASSPIPKDHRVTEDADASNKIAGDVVMTDWVSFRKHPLPENVPSDVNGWAAFIRETHKATSKKITHTVEAPVFCGSLCGTLETSQTWAILRAMLEPEKSKSATSRTLQRIVHDYPGTDEELIQALKERYVGLPATSQASAADRATQSGSAGLSEVTKLATKEGQVQGLEQLSSREHYQQSQLADRVRHYQAQCQLTEILQQELAQAQVASLSASVQQLELERDQLVHQLDEQRTQREALQHQLLEFKKSEVATEQRTSSMDVLLEDGRHLTRHLDHIRQPREELSADNQELGSRVATGLAPSLDVGQRQQTPDHLRDTESRQDPSEHVVRETELAVTAPSTPVPRRNARVRRPVLRCSP